MKNFILNRYKNNKRHYRLIFKSSLFLAPSYLGVLIFFVIPFMVVIYYSMIENPISGSFVAFENFVKVVGNNAFMKAVRNTAKFSAIAVPLAVVLSLALAVVLDSRIPLKSQMRTFFLSPMMVPVASIVLIWQVLFHYNGVINEFLQVFGADKIDWFKSEHAQIIIILLFLWKNLGYNMILFMAALGSIPKDLIEVAKLENAGNFFIFFSIKLRYLSSTILFVTIMSLINSFKVFREIYLLTGDYPYDTIYMLQHFMNNKFKSLDYQMLSAAAILMSIVMVILVAIMFAVEDRYGRDIEG
ncbi:MAG: sugar ABC transporter permease [Acetatifactor sp.]|nr:sugar ABC transporter permease [Acetatifactor sp.]